MDAAKPVRWGVLGCASTARKRFVPALARSDLSELSAIASRSLEKATAFKAAFGFSNAYDSYAKLLADPLIDAVYVPLPISEHIGWCLDALSFGKHVLCEKPLAAKASGVQALIDAAENLPGRCVAEGFMYRFHPRWLRARDLIGSGVIGKPVSITMEFSFRNVDRQNIRNQATMEGGALNDAGCYLVSASRYLLGADPVRVIGASRFDAPDEADAITSAMLDFGSCTSMMVASLRSHKAQNVTVHGESGSFRMETAFDIGPDASSSIRVEYEKGTMEIPFAPFDQFRAQIDDFCTAIRDRRSPALSLSDSLANARVLEAVRDSAAQARWIDL